MNRLDVRVLSDAAQKRRVVIFRQCSGCYAFEEQQFLDAPDFRWVPAGKPVQTQFDSEEQAIAAARALVEWLANS